MIYALLVVLLLGIGGSIGAYYKGISDCRVKSTAAVSMETVREAKAVGNIKTADAKRAPVVQAKIKEVENAKTPSNCGDADMGDVVIDRLGGVRERSVRPGADRPGTDSRHP